MVFFFFLSICSCYLYNKSSHRGTASPCSVFGRHKCAEISASLLLLYREARGHATSCRMSALHIQKWMCQTVSHTLGLLLPIATDGMLHFILLCSNKYNYSSSFTQLCCKTSVRKLQLIQEPGSSLEQLKPTSDPRQWLCSQCLYQWVRYIIKAIKAQHHNLLYRKWSKYCFFYQKFKNKFCL